LKVYINDELVHAPDNALGGNQGLALTSNVLNPNTGTTALNARIDSLPTVSTPAFVFGQGSGSSNYPQPRTEGSSIENNNFVVTRSASGKVASLEKGVLIIKDKKDKEIRVVLTKDTKFKIGKKTVKADEIDEKLFAEGSDIKVTYTPNLKNPKEFYAVEVRLPDNSKSKDKPGLN
jgi:hypothetical protein